MTAESRHHVGGSLRLAVALAMAAGFVDSFIFLRVTPVFVANMSGNLVRLGIAAGAGDWRAVGAALAAIGSFLIGAMLATARLDARSRHPRPPSPTGVLLLEAALLAALPVIIRSTTVSPTQQIGLGGVLVLVVGATAMGLQAVSLRRVGAIAVSTTHGTGAVVRLGEKLALALRRAPRPGDVRRRTTIVVLAGVLVSYVAGASVAAAVGDVPELLLAAAALPLTAGVRSWVQERNMVPEAADTAGDAPAAPTASGSLTSWAGETTSSEPATS
ncbi:MAG: hypothetical protein JWM12_854 [Ilumatobacteraceae bacterium]|nr:hypothetical protein [Ilumatobacteraceae bacterium]